MKARKLRGILKTRRSVSDHGKYIAVGSVYCHNLIAVDKESMTISYALDTSNKGRDALDSEELESIWDRLHDLIASGELKDIIEGQDDIDNPLPVYTVEDGQLIESVTDEYGWPNVTIDGHMMYDNTYFKTKAEAIQHGIEDISAGVKFLEEGLAHLEEEAVKIRERLEMKRGWLDTLRLTTGDNANE